MKKFNNFVLLIILLIVITLCVVCIKPKPQVTEAPTLVYHELVTTNDSAEFLIVYTINSITSDIISNKILRYTASKISSQEINSEILMNALLKQEIKVHYLALRPYDNEKGTFVCEGDSSF